MNSFEILGIEPTANRDEIRKAYRALARRWHPDRFMAGPERDWANEKMAAINSAYRECLDGNLVHAFSTYSEEDEAVLLKRAEALLDRGEAHEAGRLLRRLNLRSAEWNWLFGRVLLKQNKRDRAIMYLRVAVNQKPENREYATTLQKATGEKSPALLKLLHNLSRS